MCARHAAATRRAATTGDERVAGAAVLEYIAANKPVYIIAFVSLVGLSLPAIIVFLALYVALKDLDQSYAALGATIGIAAEILALAYSRPPLSDGGLLYLSDRCVAAPDAARVRDLHGRVSHDVRASRSCVLRGARSRLPGAARLWSAAREEEARVQPCSHRSQNALQWIACDPVCPPPMSISPQRPAVLRAFTGARYGR
ncbi:MAG TPA: hypothetical protein VFZ66_03030 [Herpetosiphonaceae bacterium]